MPKTRESNYDLLRICAAFAVVMLHVSGGFLRYDSMDVPTNCTLPVMLLNHVVRFAVPCFFMLSGAFLLSDVRNADYAYFYRKSFRNIGMTGIAFCSLYSLYHGIQLLISVFVLHHHTAAFFPQGLLSLLLNLLQGQPHGHLWYLFTLLGTYLAVPFVIRLDVNLRAGETV